MRREKVLSIVLVVVVGLLLSSSNALAVDCQADADCSGAVGLSDLVIMKSEFMESNCERSTKCGRCNWPCYDIGNGECTFENYLCEHRCYVDPPAGWPLPDCLNWCIDIGSLHDWLWREYCISFSY